MPNPQPALAPLMRFSSFQVYNGGLHLDFVNPSRAFPEFTVPSGTLEKQKAEGSSKQAPYHGFFVFIMRTCGENAI